MMTRAAYLGTTAWICDGDRQFFFLGGFLRCSVNGWVFLSK